MKRTRADVSKLTKAERIEFNQRMITLIDRWCSLNPHSKFADIFDKMIGLSHDNLCLLSGNFATAKDFEELLNDAK